MTRNVAIEDPRSTPLEHWWLSSYSPFPWWSSPDEPTPVRPKDAGTAAWLLNQTRAEYGLHRLMPDRELQVLANRQANRMAENG